MGTGSHNRFPEEASLEKACKNLARRKVAIGEGRGWRDALLARDTFWEESA